MHRCRAARRLPSFGATIQPAHPFVMCLSARKTDRRSDGRPSRPCRRMPGAAAVLLLLLRPAASCSFVVANYNLTMTAAWPRANFFNRFRGPDATNIAGAHGWTFVHNLLSMTGAFTLQPFLSADGRVACLFNGEIVSLPCPCQGAHRQRGRLRERRFRTAARLRAVGCRVCHAATG